MSRTKNAKKASKSMGNTIESTAEPIIAVPDIPEPLGPAAVAEDPAADDGPIFEQVEGAGQRKKASDIYRRIVEKKAVVVPKELMLIALGIHRTLRAVCTDEKEFEGQAREMGLFSRNNELAFRLFTEAYGGDPARESMEQHYRQRIAEFEADTARYAPHRRIKGRKTKSPDEYSIEELEELVRQKKAKLQH